MSQQLISRSSDLLKLRNAGFDLEVRSSYLLVKCVPYATTDQRIAFGTLVTDLTLAGDVTAKPGTHVAYFTGDFPCRKDGSEISQIRHSSERKELAPGIVVQHSFSNKPPGGYADYYEKITTYVAIIESQAQALDPMVTSKTFPTYQDDGEDSVFNYTDTASTRAEIGMVTTKLSAVHKMAIVGLGGTGSYVLDLISKTPVQEIHLFDGDDFLQHNAFRSPGAATLSELDSRPKKVDYLAKRYRHMHRGIRPHVLYIGGKTVDELAEMDFVFLCIDTSPDKEAVISGLEKLEMPFIDVGMGVSLRDNNRLGGIIRVTTSSEAKRDHIRGKNRIPFDNAVGADEYSRNIQIADLNALNAALAVIKWKKLSGFYDDFASEHHTVFSLDVNTLVNEDRP